MSVKQRGDTLIEVLFAIAVFSAVAVGALVVMNRGISAAQTALETNLVRNQVDTQAELLRHINDAKLTSLGRSGSPFAQTWDDIIGTGASPSLIVPPNPGAQDYGTIRTFDQCKPDNLPANAFFIDPVSGKIVRNRLNFIQPVTFAQIVLAPNTSTASTSAMIWIEAVNSSGDVSSPLTNTVSYDFHIRACWQSPGSNDLLKIGTIVRLYAPKV